MVCILFSDNMNIRASLIIFVPATVRFGNDKPQLIKCKWPIYAPFFISVLNFIGDDLDLHRIVPENAKWWTCLYIYVYFIWQKDKTYTHIQYSQKVKLLMFLTFRYASFYHRMQKSRKRDAKQLTYIWLLMTILYITICTKRKQISSFFFQ